MRSRTAAQACPRPAARARSLAAALVCFCAALAREPAAALDTDIFAGTGAPPNVLIIFDNSGSMGNVPYTPYPDAVYLGSKDQGTIYTRCANKNGIGGGDVNANCTCRRTQSSYVVDQSTCVDGFVDALPAFGDDIDDREGVRKKGNRLNWETNQPRWCTQSPFLPCSTQADCPGTGNNCSPQNQMGLAKSAMISTINDPDNAGVRWGLMVFNPPSINYNTANYGSTSWVTSWHVNDSVFRFPVQDLSASTKSQLVSAIGQLQANGGTPSVIRLIDAWKYFNGQVTAAGFSTSPVQYTCQRNYLVMVTDGIPEVEGDRLVSPETACTFARVQSFVGNPGDWNGDGKENPASQNWTQGNGESVNCGSDYLDDAMQKIRGLFPLGNTENQPLKLYAVSFGINYCQPPAAGDTSPGAGSLLWRASKKYGGGECISALTPNELDDALDEILNLIRNDAQSFVAPVVPVSQTNRTQSGDRIYVALFAPREGAQGWPGNVKKYALNTSAGTICNASTPSCTQGNGSATTADGTILSTAESFWDGGTGGPSGITVTSGGVGGRLQQRDPATRHIYTYLGNATGNLGGIDLTQTQHRFAKSNDAIANATLGLSGSLGQPADRDELIDFMYGYDAYDQDNDSNTTERKSWILGDIIHSVPLIVPYENQPSVILVGANDGMLHAFDDDTGDELWAFVPPDVLPNLRKLVPGEAATHPFFADGSPRMRTVGSQKVVVFGLGRGGRAYYALDVTSRTVPRLLWRVNESTSGFSELGFTTSTPDLKRYLIGGVPTEVAVFGAGYDPAFDQTSQSSANGGASAMGRGLFMVETLTGQKHAISAPSAMNFPVAGDVLLFDVNGDQVFDRGYVGDLGGQMWRLGFDLSLTRLFSAPSGLRIFYKPDAVINSGNVMVYFGTGDRTNPMRTNQSDRFYAVRDDGTSNLVEASLVDVTNRVAQVGTDAAVQLANDIRTQHGWYIRLTGTGEKVLAAPSVYFNVIFTTFTPSTEACQAGGSARVYVVDPMSGGPTRDLAGTSGGSLGGGSAGGGSGGIGSGVDGSLTVTDRFVAVGNSIPTEMKVTFGEESTKAFLGVSKGGGISLQPVNLPQITSNVVPLSWRQAW